MKHLVLVALLAGCGRKAPPSAQKYKWNSESTLAIFMKKKVNPSFSTLSFLLFHDGEADSAQIESAARELSAAAADLHAWQRPPGDSVQARQVFYEYAAGMKLDGNQLVLALQAGQREVAAKRFERLREKCDSCHHFFRFGQ